MQEIRSVAILGAGAMGAYFAAQFSDAPHISTVVVAEGPRLEKLQQDGLVVNEKHYHIRAVDPRQAGEPVDLILVALKHHHLQAAAAHLQRLVGPETLFLSVMNGLESEEYLGSIYGMEKVLYAISVGIDAVREGNRIVYTAPGTHFFGEARNDSISPRVRRVQQAFDRAGIRWDTPVDMIRKMWWKFMVNVGVNQASAVMRARYGFFQTNPDAQALMEALMQEVVTLAEAAGVNLARQDVADWYPVLNRLSPQGKTSMLQDVEAGRKTEVEVFAGKVITLGEQYGIATPVNRAVYHIIRVLEQTGPGRINPALAGHGAL
jgi:2-dehydropantoate 2-reductase